MAIGRRLNGALVLIGLGANRVGAWGPPAATLARAVRELARAGLRVEAVSGLYETAPLGGAAGGNYANAVVAVRTSLPPEGLLRRLAAIARAAGRRSARPWGPRALDLDILAYKGLVRHWSRSRPGRGGAGVLVLPHPRLHLRPFVLGPLADVAPGWRHPVLDRSARDLWRLNRGRRQGRILRRIGWPATPAPARSLRPLAQLRQSA